MVNANALLENVLLICSVVFSTWSNERNINFYLMSSLCLLSSITKWYDTSTWIRFSRRQVQASLWYGCLVVPLIVDLQNTTSELLSANVIFIVMFMIAFNDTKNSGRNKYAVLALLTYVVLYGSYISLMFNLLTYVVFVFKVVVFVVIFFMCFILCSNSFSVGEAIATAQLITHFFINGFSVLFVPSFNVITLAVWVGYSSGILVALVVLGISIVKKLQQYNTFYFYTVFCLISFLVILEKGFLTIYALSVDFLCQNYPTRQILIMLWLILCLMCSVYVAHRPVKVKASTIERKHFHLFILVVYFSGLIFDIPLLFISSVTVFCLFVIASTMCAYQIKPFGPRITQLFLSFTDKQDEGKFILTPVYLIFGLSFPIWLCFINDMSWTGGVSHSLPIKCLSGILSVGVGDACASWFGSKYGKTNIPGSIKTIEGTVASIIVQLVVILLLVITQIIETDIGVAIIATSVVAFIELVSNEIDNLVLPLVTFMLFSVQL